MTHGSIRRTLSRFLPGVAWLPLALVLAGCGPVPAGPGSPCASALDCRGGLCVAIGSAGPVCADRCDDGRMCGPGLQCAVTDVASLCVPDGVANCQPCQAASDCNQAGLSGYACLAYGAAGSFCGARCGTDEDCPQSYGCLAGWCRLGVGDCACNDIGIALAAETTCEIGTPHGTCLGMRGCGAAGLSACVGPRATAEVCDGRDNDCDGLIDEGLACGQSRRGAGTEM